jgi:hypothetical protein
MKASKYLFLLIAVIASCSNTPTPPENPTPVAPVDTPQPEIKPAKVVSVKDAATSKYNCFARFIAGMHQKEVNTYSKTEKDSVWIDYAAKLNAKWTLMTNRRTAKLNTWAGQEVPKAMRESEVLFYPFSGADILNANLLFPKAKSYYMFGLEPVGYLPDVLLHTNQRDTLERYFNSLNSSLNAVTNFSFFRTKSMKVDFNSEELNGTIHLILLFLARNGNAIADIRYVYIDENGVQQDNMDRKVTHNDGVEITFADPEMQAHTVTYYSTNLDNNNYGSNNGMQAYIKGLGTFNTYLKAASYLMHNASFSAIRGTITGQTKYLLQDDSGIPYKYFSDRNKWNISLYGVYVPPIPLFSNYNQKDLDSAYRDSTIMRKPLNFGIGYNFNQSNLMLFEKK